MNRFLDDLTEFSECRLLVISVTSAVKEPRIAPEEALILLRPFDILDIFGRLTHDFDSSIAFLCFLNSAHLAMLSAASSLSGNSHRFGDVGIYEVALTPLPPLSIKLAVSKPAIYPLIFRGILDSAPINSCIRHVTLIYDEGFDNETTV